MITSASNPKVKYVRRLLADRRFREREAAFVVEGGRWLAELARFGLAPRLLLATEIWLDQPENRALLAPLAAEPTLVSEVVLAHASDTESPAGVLAVAPMAPGPLPASPTLLLILDAVANPGNLGTMLRTAAAAGVEGVILAPGCVDAYNPKVVRGGMGAQLRLAVQSAGWAEIGRLTSGQRVWLAAAGGATLYHHVDWRQPSALIVGSEASGVGPEARELAQGRVSIPMNGETESLNAAVAAGVILFEAARQRAERHER
jgi:RNA methyltransferase, TrmH family